MSICIPPHVRALAQAVCQLGAIEHGEEFPDHPRDRLGDFNAGFWCCMRFLSEPQSIQDVQAEIARKKARYLGVST